MSTKFKVGVLGATGMVGQRFLSLLEEHPWFEVTTVAASPSSAGKTYLEAVTGRWAMKTPIPEAVKNLRVYDVSRIDPIASSVDFVFCAVDMPKEATAHLEEAYARAETPVVSNNSAHRWTPDVPMILPELNPDHARVIVSQQKRLGVHRGFIVVKPNCSLQSYVPTIHPLQKFGPKQVMITTFQALSGAGKTLESWPEMSDNVIPFIKGEEEKSEQEPLKIWGNLRDGQIVKASSPTISAQCVRVPVSDGHLVAVSVAFEQKPSREQILLAWQECAGQPQKLNLPSAPHPFLQYQEEEDRPQTRLDRDQGKGQAITIGRLRPDPILDWRYLALSHNTIRGAAGGAVLTAELLVAEGYLSPRS